jgi:hypothetical protein
VVKYQSEVEDKISRVYTEANQSNLELQCDVDALAAENNSLLAKLEAVVNENS